MFFLVFYIFTVFLFFFFSPPLFQNDINPSQHWRVTPASHQGGIQTQSISHSNSCIWRVPVRHPNAFQLSVKTPPCLLFTADPCPTSSQPVPALPLHSHSAPCPHYCSLGFFIPHAKSQSSCPRVDSTPRKRAVSMVPQVCGRPPETCFNNAQCSRLLLACLFLLFCSVFCQVF